MQTISMVGLYSADVLPRMQERLSHKFRFLSIPSYENYDALAETDYIILRGLKISADVIKTLKKTRLIHRWGAGYDSVDVEAAGKAGIPVAVTAGVNAAAVSELAISLMLVLYRRIVELDAMLKRGEWERQAFIDRSFTIKGKTVGLFGCGSIGRLVAKKVKVFGANVIYHDVFRLTEHQEKEYGVRFVTADELLSQADIVSVHVPAIDSTKGMFNRSMFEKMKPSAIFINTARGSVVNEAELEEALKNGIIAGAGLDTFTTEPLPQGSGITQCPNVVLTPHMGGNTCDINTEMVEKIIENILLIERGETLSPPDLVNGAFLKV